MAVPMMGREKVGFFQEDLEVRMYFPIMMTSPAFVHASDTYLDHMQFRDVSVNAVYAEASQMDPEPDWDGTKRDWSTSITEVSTDFVNPSGAIDLNAGEIDLPMLNGKPDKTKIIKEIAVLRSNLSEGLLRWQEVTRITNGSIQDAYLYDYFVENGNYYRYALQPITADGRKGPITGFYDAVSTLEGFWMLGEKDKQFSFIYDGRINTINHNQASSMVETITGEFPYAVTSSDLNYRTFQFTGKLTFEQDVHRLFVSNTYSEAISPDPTIPINFVEIAYGDESLLNCKNDLEEMDNSMVMQRIWRKKITDWMKDGKPKILKSEAEGNILVYITDVNVTPIVTLYGLIVDFSCQMTEIGNIRESTLKKYDLRKEVMSKSELLKEQL